MKIMKDNKKHIVICLLVLIFLAIFNYFIYNYKIIKLDNKNNIDISLKNISYDDFSLEKGKLVSNKNNPSITIFLNKYVDKICFNYNTNKNLDVSEKIEYYNVHAKVKDIKSLSSNYYDTHMYVKKIGKNVRKITIEFNNSDNNLELSDFYIKSVPTFNFYTFLFMSFVFLNTYIIVVKRKYFCNNIEKAFLLISLSAGFLITISMPPVIGTSFDDQIHFKNSYELFDRNLKKSMIIEDYKNVKLNFSMFDTLEERKDIISYIDNNRNQYYDYQFVDYFSYKKIGYLPSAIVIKICSMFNLPFVLIFILGRAVNVVIYSFIMYLAIKIIPVHKNLLLYISLIPTSIFMSAQYTLDVIVTSFLSLAFAIFIKEMYDEKINIKLVMLFLLSVFIACSSKPVYAPISLLLLLISKDKFNDSKKSKIFKIGIIIFFILLLFTSFVPMTTAVQNISDPRGGDTSVSRQVELIIKKPIHFSIMFINEVFGNFFKELISPGALFCFSYFGNLNNSTIYYITLIGLIFVSITDNTSKKYLSIFNKIFIFLIVSFIICMIWGSMYLAYTPVGELTINGVQARYFISLLIPIIVCFSSNNIKNNIKKSKYISIVSLLSIICLFFSIYFQIISNYCL